MVIIGTVSPTNGMSVRVDDENGETYIIMEASWVERKTSI
jgi:hypothetical protein